MTVTDVRRTPLEVLEYFKKLALAQSVMISI